MVELVGSEVRIQRARNEHEVKWRHSVWKKFAFGEIKD